VVALGSWTSRALCADEEDPEIFPPGDDPGTSGPAGLRPVPGAGGVPGLRASGQGRVHPPSYGDSRALVLRERAGDLALGVLVSVGHEVELLPGQSECHSFLLPVGGCLLDVSD
jgi:hypothetical protein